MANPMTRQSLCWACMFLLGATVLACDEEPCRVNGPCGKGGATGGNAAGGSGTNVGGEAGGGADGGIFAPPRPGCEGMRLGPCTAVFDSQPLGPDSSSILYVHVLDSVTIQGMPDEPAQYAFTRYYERGRLLKEEAKRGDTVDEVRTFEYDDQGRVEKELRDNNMDGENDEGSLLEYDDQGRLLSRFCYLLTEAGGCFGLEEGMYTGWDDVGNPTEQVSGDFGDVYTYDYDSSCNLERETRWNAREPGQRMFIYATDYEYSCW